jgi:hypothetical protein
MNEKIVKVKKPGKISSADFIDKKFKTIFSADFIAKYLKKFPVLISLQNI